MFMIISVRVPFPVKPVTLPIVVSIVDSFPLVIRLILDWVVHVSLDVVPLSLVVRVVALFDRVVVQQSP